MGAYVNNQKVAGAFIAGKTVYNNPAIQYYSSLELWLDNLNTAATPDGATNLAIRTIDGSYLAALEDNSFVSVEDIAKTVMRESTIRQAGTIDFNKTVLSFQKHKFTILYLLFAGKYLVNDDIHSGNVSTSLIGSQSKVIKAVLSFGATSNVFDARGNLVANQQPGVAAHAVYNLFKTNTFTLQKADIDKPIRQLFTEHKV